MSKKRLQNAPPKETPLTKITSQLSGSNYRGECDYDVEQDDDCDHNYCSCSRYTNARVTRIDLKGIIKACVECSNDLIDEYCIDRILHINSHKLKDTINWEPDIQGGYYGDECHGAMLCASVRDDILFHMHELFARNTTLDKIFCVLELEYGYLADIIKNAKDFQIVNVEKEQLIIPNQDYARRLNMDLVNEYSDHNLPIGIYIEQQTKPVKYRLVDGTHRTMAFLKSKRIRADIFVTKF